MDINSPINNFDTLLEMAYGLGQNAERISQQQFVDMIIEFDNSSKGTRPMSITTVTVPYKRAKANPYTHIYKVSQTNGFIHGDYSSRVNLQREREGKPADFKAQPNRNIKEYVSKSIAVTATGKTSLIFHPNLANKPPSYYFGQLGDGTIQEIDRDEATRFLPAPRPAVTQGTESAVDYRLYGVEGIIAAAFEGKEFFIENDNPLFVEIFSKVADRLRS